MIAQMTETESLIDSLRQSRQANWLLRDDLRYSLNELQAAIDQAVEVVAQTSVDKDIGVLSAKRKESGPWGDQ
jgi:hypothetical protein